MQVAPINLAQRLSEWRRVKVSPKGLKSLIWSSLPAGFSKYHQTKASHANIIICETCVSSPSTSHCEIDYGASKSTSNIKSHVSTHHKQEYDAFLLQKIQRSKQSTTVAGIASISTFFAATASPALANQREIEVNSIIKLIVCKHLPLSIVEADEFRDYAKCLNPKARVFSRKQIGEELRTEFLKCREKSTTLFQQLCPLRRAAVTVDHWTSISNETYGSLTVHWITDKFDLMNMPFNIRKMSGHTTGSDIATDIKSMCQATGVLPTCAVSDCEPAMVAAWRFMDHGAQGCTDHRLEKIANKIFNSPSQSNALKKARKVAGHFHSSSQANDQLRQMSKLVLNRELTTVQDVETRWWSTWSCCSRLLELKSTLVALVSIQDGTFIPIDCRLSEDEWSTLRVCVSILTPLMETERTLEGEKYVTASLTIPLIFSIRRSLEEQALVPDISEDTRSSLTVMLNALTQRFGTLETTLPIDCLHGNALEGKKRQPCGFTQMQNFASALDIRTKSRFWLPEVDWPRLDRSMLQAVLQLVTLDTVCNATIPIIQPSTHPIIQVSGSSFDAFSMPNPVVHAHHAIPAAVEITADCNRELLLFSRITQASGKIHDTNPLDFWKANADKYPLLSKLAKCSFGIPSTSGSSERLFSESGLVSTKKRNRLAHESIEELVFLRKWYAFIEEWKGKL